MNYKYWVLMALAGVFLASSYYSWYILKDLVLLFINFLISWTFFCVDLGYWIFRK
jgi:hypothetical protein